MPRRHAAIDRLLFEEAGPVPALINARLGHWAAFPLFCPRLKNENADGGPLLSDNRALGRWGRGELGVEEHEEEEEKEGVRNVGTRSLGDHSPGSPSVWQLWKFIAIDFVISSLSIGSTWAHWWIARKLFLQSCFFKTAPPPRTTSCVLSCPFFPAHLLRCLYRFFYSLLLSPLATKHSIMARFGSGLWLKCACVCWCGKKEQNIALNC